MPCMLSHKQPGALLLQMCNHKTMTNTETLIYLVECLEVGPAQAGAALAAPHILHLILTIAHMAHCHTLSNSHGKRYVSTPAEHKTTSKH